MWSLGTCFISTLIISLNFNADPSEARNITGSPRYKVCPSHISSVFNESTRIRFLLSLWRHGSNMMMIGRAKFWLGSDKSVAIRGDNEYPRKFVEILAPYWLHKYEVTVEDFKKFVGSTGYVTTAELIGSSFIFWMQKGSEFVNSKSKLWWWMEENKINYKFNSTLRHPVSHVSWIDAYNYCHWIGGKLPNEKEWEFACKAGCDDCLYSWGNKLRTRGKYMGNIWQGTFPSKNSVKDGHLMAAPVGSYLPNAYGLFDMSGNVWEWIDGVPAFNSDLKVQKGGSFLCHKNHCYRYRCGARTFAHFSSSSSNIGFRCAVHL